MTHYFYIIERSGSIHELEYTKERYQTAFEEWQKGGKLIVTVPDALPYGINAVDVVNILPADKYDEFTKTCRLKRYIKDGSWFDTKSREFIEHTAWKQRRIANEQNKIASRSVVKQTPEQIEAERQRLIRAMAENRKILEAQGILKPKEDLSTK